MIANARMYSLTATVAERWRALFAALIDQGSDRLDWLDYPAPAPLAALWERDDKGAVFMCGLPFSRGLYAAHIVAAPVPSPPEFAHRPQYWSEFVVRSDRGFTSLPDTFGGRIAFTDPGSQSGYAAALDYLRNLGVDGALYQTLIEPQITPLGAVSAVLESRADVAPIDAYAWALLKRHHPQLIAPLHSVARTAPAPIPLIVASHPEAVGVLREALLNAHERAAIRPLLEELLLERFVIPQPHDYDALRLNFEHCRAFWRARSLATSMHPAFV